MGQSDRFEPRRAHAWIRRNVLGLVAIFLALNGTAVAVQVSKDTKGSKQDTQNAKTSKKKKKAKVKPGPAGPQGPQGSAGPQGPQGPAGPSTGPAAGDLTGNYPNPTIAPGAVTATKVAAANVDGAGGTPSLRSLGTGAQQAASGNDPRFTDSRTPTGAAGGALSGTYPSPSLNVTGGTATATSCNNGQEISAISTLAAITCTAGVYSDGSSNVAAGPTSFPASITGNNNAALGSGALDSTTSGDRNIAVGSNALTANTTGDGNVAIGHEALDNSQDSGNTAVGTSALGNNTIGGPNEAFGASALFNNTEGNDNAAFGQAALFSNNVGVGNVAFGRNAALSNMNGEDNVAVGVNTLFVNPSGSSNTALGARAMDSNSGTDNIGIGADGGQALTTGANNIAIGNPGVAGDASTTRIGDTQTAAFMAGISGATSASGAAVLVNASGKLGTSTSSRRYKTEIEPLAGLGDELMALEPVSFRYREGSDELHYGLIAEQVEKVLPTLVAYGRDGLPETVQYHELPALLLAKVQDQQRENDVLRSQNRRQQEQIDWLMRQVGGG